MVSNHCSLQSSVPLHLVTATASSNFSCHSATVCLATNLGSVCMFGCCVFTFSRPACSLHCSPYHYLNSKGIAHALLLLLCVRFGAAIAGSGSELQQVSQELQAHEGQAVQVVFLRAGQAVQLQLVPRRWEGRGLLGCHLRPL